MAYLLAEIAAEAICRCDVGALLSGGSDTTYAICDTLQVQKIDVLGSTRTNPSTIISKLHIDNGEVFYMGSRGGAVGGPDEILEALEVLRPTRTMP
jgi:uncharacterized protein YgbK (DUF1537 family)